MAWHGHGGAAAIAKSLGVVKRGQFFPQCDVNIAVGADTVAPIAILVIRAVEDAVAKT